MSNPLLDLISHGESQGAGYNAYNRGTYIDEYGKPRIRPADESIDFSTLTLGQVLDKQHLGHDDPDRILAVGKYQIIPKTMDGAVDKLNLDRNQLFTPELQDKIFSEYLIVNKRPDVHDYITGKPGVTLADAQRGLAQEWGSFGDPDNNGQSHYPPPNKSSITLEQSAVALNKMQTDYKANIDRGLTPDAAWQAITDSGRSNAQTQTDLHHGVADGVLRQGAHGAVVSALQSDLAALGYTDNRGKPLQPDGHYGRNTEAAVMAFQSDHGLHSDGVAGKNTLDALQGQRQLLSGTPALAPELPGSPHPRIDRIEPANRAPVQRDARAPALPDSATPSVNPYADPRHPNHGLYAELRERIPNASENRIVECTAACHMAGIRSGELGQIHLRGKEALVFAPNGGAGGRAEVALTSPAPPIQQTIQHVQGFEQNQQMAIAQMHAQQQQAGPVMGGPRMG